MSEILQCIGITDGSGHIEKTFFIPRNRHTKLAFPGHGHTSSVADMDSEPVLPGHGNGDHGAAVGAFDLVILHILLAGLLREKGKLQIGQRMAVKMVMDGGIPVGNDTGLQPLQKHIPVPVQFLCGYRTDKIQDIFPGRLAACPGAYIAADIVVSSVAVADYSDGTDLVAAAERRILAHLIFLDVAGPPDREMKGSCIHSNPLLSYH